jgi:hypothetical protein
MRRIILSLIVVAALAAGLSLLAAKPVMANQPTNSTYDQPGQPNGYQEESTVPSTGFTVLQGQAPMVGAESRAWPSTGGARPTNDYSFNALGQIIGAQGSTASWPPCTLVRCS